MKKFIALAAVAAGLLGVAAPAMAHVTLQPNEAPADGFTRLAVRVPNERDNASTTKVEVKFPPGFYSVSYEPVADWSVDVKMRKLDKPAEQFGEKVTEEVAQVSISTSGAGIAAGPVPRLRAVPEDAERAGQGAHVQGASDLHGR